MSFPHITSITAGLLLPIHRVLAFAVSGNRRKVDTGIGDGGDTNLLRLIGGLGTGVIGVVHAGSKGAGGVQP